MQIECSEWLDRVEFLKQNYKYERIEWENIHHSYEY